MTSAALVLAAPDAIGPVIWYAMLLVLPQAVLTVAVGGAWPALVRSRCRTGAVMGMAKGCDGHELSSPIGGIGHSRGWQPGSKVSMMTIKAGVMEDGLVSPVDEGTPQVSPDSMSRSRLNPVEPPWYATRMPGGVGGVAPRGVPLSRSMRLIGRFGST